MPSSLGIHTKGCLNISQTPLRISHIFNIRRSRVPHLIVISCLTIQGRKSVGTTEWGTLRSGTV
eukprot:1494895-Amphidinium_carterae.2